jgi:hypothetical protein
VVCAVARHLVGKRQRRALAQVAHDAKHPADRVVDGLGGDQQLALQLVQQRLALVDGSLQQRCADASQHGVVQRLGEDQPGERVNRGVSLCNGSAVGLRVRNLNFTTTTGAGVLSFGQPRALVCCRRV